MSATSGASRFDASQMYRVARMYYLEACTQAEIAQQVGISRPTVSRLLAEARRAGIVEIRVNNPAEMSSELDEKLRDALGIDRVWLAPSVGAQPLGVALRDVASEAIEAAGLHPGDTLLVSSGKTVFELSRQNLVHVAGLQIAPTVGGIAEPEAWYQTNEITRSFAEQSGGRPYFLFAQAVPSLEMRHTLDADPSFQEIVKLWDGAKAAIVGIGAPLATRSSISAFIPTGAESLSSAVGDICLNFYDDAGAELMFDGADRMVRTPPDLLRGMPFVLAVAVGQEKTRSIAAGARAGLYNNLVTDVATAQSVLTELGA